jgi:hypothetical protein
MKSYLILFLLAVLLPACSQDNDKKIKKQVTAVAEKYIMSQLTNPQRKISEYGQITISDEQKKYIIEPSRIVVGLIDDDTKEDAIVSVLTFQGQYQTVSEQLIILRTGKDFTLARAMESDMRIISLKDRIITADVPEHSRNTPLFNCQSCWEVVKFQFNMGELVKIE